jgi:pimeloyl-ACP methyl ester carboxylesterase
MSNLISQPQTPARRRALVLAALVTGAGCAAAPAHAAESTMSHTTVTDHHTTLHGLDLHYTTRGTGAPLVLLHGGVGASEMFDAIAPALAAHRQIIAIDLEGHGESGDRDRPLRFETMADDVAALLAQLGLSQVDVAGYSLGGGVAARLAIQHPALVGRLALISTAFARDGWYPEVLAQMAHMGPEAAKYMGQSPLAKRYPARDWARLFTRLGDLLRQDYDWTRDAQAIQARVLLVYADADAVRPASEHAWYGLFGGGQRDAGLDGSGRSTAQLAIVPNATHYGILGSPLITPILDGFFAAR